MAESKQHSKLTKEKEQPKPEKETYTIRFQYLVPVEATYKVVAESPEQALQSIIGKFNFSHPPKLNWGRAKKIKASVVKFGNLLVCLSKQF